MRAPDKSPMTVASLGWAHWLAVIASLLLTIAAWRISDEQIASQSEARFEREAAQVIELVVERLQRYELALWGGASAVQALGGDVSLEEWRTFAETSRIDREYPGISGIGVIHRVAQADLESYSATQRILRPGFRVHPATSAAEHFPITYIEPVEHNAAALGLDMTHETNRNDGIMRVRDSGRPQLTGPIALIQSAQGRSPGFLLFVPFYRGGRDQSFEERRRGFAGAVYAPFNARDLMAGTLSRERRHVGVRIADGVDVLYDEHVRSEPDYDPAPQYSTTQDVDLYGRTWRFDIQSTRSFRAAAATRQPLFVLMGGIVVDILLLAFFVLLTRTNRSVLANNRELTQTVSQLGEARSALESTTTALELRDAELQRQREEALKIAEQAKAAQASAEEAERRSSVIVESAPNAVVMVDESGVIVLVNAETERIFGYRREELVGEPIGRLIPAGGGTTDEDVTASGLGTALEWQGVRKDGTTFPVEMGLNPIETPQGRFVLSAIVDTSERRDAQRRFELAVESAPNAMVMVDESGRIVLVNAEAERIFGYDRAEMLGQSIERLVPTRFAGMHPDARRSLFSSSEPRSMSAGRELFALRKDGSEFPVEIGLNPIETPEGRFVLSAIVDNTERRRILDQLENRTEEMEQLLYTVSHDLKSPLVTIQGFSNFISAALEQNDLADARDSAARVSRATKTMAALINDVLALSRVANASEKEEWVEVGALVADVEDSLNAQFVGAGAKLVINTELPRIWTIESRVRQILQNLIGNALKYGCEEEGGAIEVGCVDAPRHHKFYVRDEGPGIAAANHRKVFVIFRRMNTRKEGSGLGLAIVMKAARSLGGQAWVESTPGEGSTFWFSVAKGQRRRSEKPNEGTRYASNRVA